MRVTYDMRHLLQISCRRCGNIRWRYVREVRLRRYRRTPCVFLRIVIDDSFLPYSFVIYMFQSCYRRVLAVRLCATLLISLLRAIPPVVYI